MEEQFTYSLRKYLDEYFTEISRAVIIEDGVTLTGVEKPFVSIEYLGNNSELLSAGRNSYEEIHRYQIGLFASSGQQRSVLREKLRTHLLAPTGIPIYSFPAGTKTGSRFLMDIDEFTAMTSDAEANETYQHHGYHIGAIEILRNVGESSFTQ
jgi:hypothetical protein